MQKLNGPKYYFTLTQQEWNSQFEDVVISKGITSKDIPSLTGQEIWTAV